ncbi:hypothetical protein Y10_28470 [Neptunitalea sp. Y10]|uniref:Peptidylprolyl isomerase n=2 Tax=Neptunitalea lumnitzerae TaxID=2965509 RepID=A0ABQ5MM83_9FLAO|nr:hypothetical protein Y10_28470 [Neptunitalea sp. Y10]
MSCNNNDDDVSITPPRDLTEVLLEDEEAMQAYLETHFYNYEDFENPPADFDYKIVLDTIEGANADKIALIDQVTTKTVTIKDADDQEVDHNLYYLIAREGIGHNPHSADSVFVRYTGTSLTNVDFDHTVTPVWFDQIGNPYYGNSTGVVLGFKMFTPELKTGTYVGLDNGVPEYEDYGIGMVLMPSGLAYFNTALTGVAAYSPLIFRIDMLASVESDHDGDKIPSYYEDQDGDAFFYNVDTDENGIADIYDVDDDGDGTLTKDEIEWTDLNGDGRISVDEINFLDYNNDGVPDYLDPDYPEAEE